MTDYNELLAKQREYFATGKTKEYSFRQNALKALKESMYFYGGEVQAALKTDLNKAEFEAFIGELGITIQHITHAQQHLKSWMRQKHRKTGVDALPGISYEVYDPYGVVLIMSPWNYPFLLTMGALIGAIAAGNCCIIKPSAYAPASSEVISKIIKRAFPQEYITTVQGGRKENQQLLDQRFDYIFFTGSVAVGKEVMEKASRHLTPVTLELGGKSPCIITGDANIKEAAKTIAFGKLLNSGQTCIAPDYVLIDEKLKDSFCAEITNQIKVMLGDPMTNDEYPHMVNVKHFERVVNLMNGVTVYSGGRSDREKLCIEPTILVDVREDSLVMGEEIFGPLLPVISFKTIDEAEEFVLRHEKPLALYLYTTNKKTEKRLLKNLSFGGGCVNDTIMHMMTMGLGFGGVGCSGMGLYHGKYGFDSFSHTKGIYKKSLLLEIPLRYHPYNKLNLKLAHFLMK